MLIEQLLAEKRISKYRLSKDSGVPYMTINDVCNGKVRIEKCSGETLYRIAKTLGVCMEELIVGGGSMEYRSSFEIFKSNVCHRLKDLGDIDFIIDTLESNEIRRLYEKRWYPESLYLLAMLDYISRENDIPLCTNYDDIRAQRLKDVLYPADVLLMSRVTHDDMYITQSWNDAIPEFKRFNIIENEVRSVL